MVGFQTNLTYGEQKRVFHLIPGLENARFVRYGLMHRNSYILSPLALNKNLTLKNNNDVIITGQLSGVEGYVESSAMGILAAISAMQIVEGKDFIVPPLTTMLGSLYNYILNASPKDFSPMNANFGILNRSPQEDKMESANKAIKDIKEFWSKVNV